MLWVSKKRTRSILLIFAFVSGFKMDQQASVTDPWYFVLHGFFPPLICLLNAAVKCYLSWSLSFLVTPSILHWRQCLPCLAYLPLVLECQCNRISTSQCWSRETLTHLCAQRDMSKNACGRVVCSRKFRNNLSVYQQDN